MFPRLPGVFALVAFLSVARAEPGQFSEKWQTLTGCTLIDNEWNDGDSFHVRHDGREYIFRLYFVDAPETHDVSPGKSRTTEQAAYWKIKKGFLAVLADRATAFSRDQLSAGSFTVLTRWEDAKGESQLPRNFAVIQTRRGDLAELLVANGLARIHGHFLGYPGGPEAAAYRNRLKSLESRARSARLGGWGDGAAATEATVEPAAARPASDEATSPADTLSEIPGF